MSPVLIATPSHAQWSVVVLTPEANGGGTAYATRDGLQFGAVSPPGSGGACIWSGSSDSITLLNPAGSTQSRVWSGTAAVQGGYAYYDSVFRAGIWAGSAGSWTELHPIGATSSMVQAVDGATQAGYAFINNRQQAGIWNGTRESWVSLDPAGSLGSIVYGAGGGQQVGRAIVGMREVASLWTGSAASWVRLVPQGTLTSVAYATDGRQQVGSALIGLGYNKASLWRGSAASWIDLNPAPLVQGEARAVFNGLQAGSVRINNVGKACIWNGSPATFEDLSVVLPAGLDESVATGIWTDGTTVFVSGYATNRSVAQTVALLWTKPLCIYLTDDSSYSPPATVRCPGQTLSIPVTVQGPGPFTYQWRRNGVPLASSGPNSIPSAAAPTLIFSSLRATDAGDYDCVIVAACGTVTSSVIRVVVRQPCSIADVVTIGGTEAGNCGDGQLTPDDVVAFLAAFFSHQPLADIANLGGGSQPDGQFTVDDVIAFLSAFFAGCT